MAVHDRWHTKRPAKFHPMTKKPVTCEHHQGGERMYPSAEHGQGDRWQVRWRDDNNKQCSANRPKKGGRRSESDPDVYAEALDVKIEGELNSGAYIDPAAGKITLKEFTKQWREGHVADLSTLETLDGRLAHIYGTPIAGTPLATLAKKPSLIQQWLKGMERKGLSQGYRHHILGILSSIFIAAIDDGVIARNPTKAKSLSRPKLRAPDIVPLTAGQVRAARKAMGRNAAMVDLGVGAGLRESEVAGLAEDDIVFLGHDRHLKVRRQVKRVKDEDGEYHMVFAPPKHRKTRKVTLADSLARRLTEQIKAHPPMEVTLPWEKPGGRPVTVKLLFIRPRRTPWYRQAIVEIWSRARGPAKIPAEPAFGFHCLRHTYASEQLAAGVDIRTLAGNLGHTDPGFTLRRYTHFMPKTADKARAAVDRFLADVEQSARDVPSATGE